MIFAGYQAEGSLGRRLIDGAKKVKIMGEDIVVGAKIYNLSGFSAHADRDQMLALVQGDAGRSPKPSSWSMGNTMRPALLPIC